MQHNLKAIESYEAKRKLDYVSLTSGSDLLQQKRKKGTVEICFNVVDRDEVDKEIARMFYAFALPFSTAKNSYFRQFVYKLANSKLAGYVPPTYNKLRTMFLNACECFTSTFSGFLEKEGTGRRGLLSTSWLHLVEDLCFSNLLTLVES